MTAAHLPVIIVGSGIAGLSLARVLAQHNIPVRVFEKASATRREGYGISVREWAARPFCDEIGMEYETFIAACAADADIRGHGLIDPVVYDLHTLEPLTTPSPAPTGSPKASFFRANRNRIRTTLMADLNVAFDVALESIDTSETPRMIKARFSNGEVVEGCLLIGADGVHSTVRSLELSGQEPVIVPAAIASGVRRLSRSQFDRFFAPYLRGSNAMLAVADYVLAGLTVVDITESSVELFWSWIRPTKGDQDSLYLANQSKNGAAQLRGLMRSEISALGPIAEPYREILDIEKMQSDEMFNWLMRSVRIPTPDLLKALERNIVLIGDAAHAMPFFAGEGGNHALLDGVELGQLVGHLQHNWMDSVADFYRRVESRWSMAVSGSIQGMSRLMKPLDEWRHAARK